MVAGSGKPGPRRVTTIRVSQSKLVLFRRIVDTNLDSYTRIATYYMRTVDTIREPRFPSGGGDAMVPKNNKFCTPTPRDLYQAPPK